MLWKDHIRSIMVNRSRACFSWSAVSQSAGEEMTVNGRTVGLGNDRAERVH
jgi:hypothetical protein